MNYIKDQNLKDEVSNVHDYVLNTYEYLHQYPELGLQEYKTTAFIRDELTKMNIKWLEASPTGTIGIIDGDDSDNILALRADIDGLKVKEESDVPFKSLNEGLMHACGHDSHVATLLGTAKILKERYEYKFKGQIYLLFQPGEETAIGAKAVIASKQVDNVKTFYGQHIWAYEDIGKIQTRANAFMTGARIFNIEVIGISGHGSALEKTANPLVAASNIVLALQTIVSNNIKAQDTAVVCVGGINGGGQCNAVPLNCHIIGTTRFMDKEMDETLCKRIEEIAISAAKTYNCEAIVTYKGSVDALYTDEELTNLAKKGFNKIVGIDNVVDSPLVMGSEDFADYGKIGKIAFGLIGCRNENKNANETHHSCKFKIDEDSLDIAVAGYLSFVKEYYEL